MQPFAFLHIVRHQCGSNETCAAAMKTEQAGASGGENEIEEYVAELTSAEFDCDDAAPIQGKVGLSNIEEIRRLMAYVAISKKEFRRCKNLDLVVCKTDCQFY